jgi:nitrate/nitrite transporter NarK
MVIVVVATSVCCGLQQQQPSLLAGHGFAPEKISLILSVQTAVLAAAKVCQGILYGGFGVRRGGTATLAIFALGMLMLTVKALVYPALVLVAIGLGIYTTLFPLVTRQVFGTREYAAIWSLIATAGSVGTVVLNPLWGVIYDASGSYTIALIGGPVLLAGAIWALNRMMGDRR